MKHLYFLFFFFLVSVSYGQDTKAYGDIEGFELYPNPVTNGKVYISTKEDGSKKILIFDVFGSQVMETTIVGPELNVSELDAGVYVLRVFEKDRLTTRKLIVK